MKTLLGKYILHHWVNGEYESKSLRYINRENKKYYISDVGRTSQDYKKNIDKKIFIYDWAIKLVKDNTNELGFKRSLGKKANLDGIMNYTILDSDSLNKTKCQYTFDELFNTDLRELQTEEQYPLAIYLRRNKTESIFKPDFKPELFNDDDIKYCYGDYFYYKLKELFKVNKIFSLIEKVSEHRNLSKLGKSGILFHMNHYKINEKSISLNDNKNNWSITYWLFDDCLVFQEESGKSTW